MKCSHPGEAVARTLIDLDVEYVFTLTGGHLNLIHLFLEDSPVKLVDTRHEQGATFMADAFGRMTGKPGVVMVTAGPGFTNALSAVQHAYCCCTPMLIIAGAAGMEFRDKLDLQDAAQVPVITPMVKQAFLCTEPERAAEYTARAYRMAMTGRPGPVYLELPCDILGKPMPSGECRTFQTPSESRPVDIEGVDKTLALLKKAQRPIVIAGSGAGASRAGAELTTFIEQSGIPLFTVNNGRGLVSDTHPCCLGIGAPTWPLVAAKAYAEADVILILGHRISLNQYFGASFNPQGTLIQIDIEAEEIGRNRSVAVPVFSDVRAFLHKLNAEMRVTDITPSRFASWLEELQNERQRCTEAQRAFMESNNVPIHPQRLIHEINTYMDRDDDVVLGDGGDTHTWLHIGRTSRTPYRMLDQGLFWCIGAGICNAIAARLVYPKSRVMLVTGDGSLGFNFIEVNTAVRKGMPLVIVVSNDQSWGMIRHSQELRLGRPLDSVAWLGATPYHSMVEGAGGIGFLIEKPQDIRPALDEAFKSGKVACLNVMTDTTVVSPGSQALAKLGAYKSK